MQLTLPQFYSGDVDLLVVALYHESTREGTVHIPVQAIATPPNLMVEDTCFDNVTNGSTFVDLFIESSLADKDGSENLTVVITGIPNTAALSVGLRNSDGHYTLMPEDFENRITLQLLNSTEPFEINITAIATELTTGEMVYTNSSLSVSICISK